MNKAFLSTLFASAITLTACGKKEDAKSDETAAVKEPTTETKPMHKMAPADEHAMDKDEKPMADEDEGKHEDDETKTDEDESDDHGSEEKADH